MINVITDLIQSASIIIWGIFVIFLARKVNRHENRLDVQKITKDYREAHGEPQPICGCTHHQCFHDDNGCGKMESQAVYSTGLNSITRESDKSVPCGCKRYTGPEPLPSVIP